jgi:hypothetical protein
MEIREGNLRLPNPDTRGYPIGSCSTMLQLPSRAALAPVNFILTRE